LLKVCDPNIQTDKGRTVLYHDVSSNNLECVKLLLKHNIDQISDHDDKTPLHIAIHNRDYTICELLLKHGACISNEMIRNLDDEFFTVIYVV
jgi:ankyrin repeat protein